MQQIARNLFLRKEVKKIFEIPLLFVGCSVAFHFGSVRVEVLYIDLHIFAHISIKDFVCDFVLLKYNHSQDSQATLSEHILLNFLLVLVS